MIFVLKFVFLLLLTRETRAEVSLMNGDVIINGLFDIYDSNNGRCSSDISPSSVKNFEAIKWTLRMINSNNYVPGIKIGIQAWPTCGLVSEANDKAIDFINKIHSDKTDTNYQSPPVIAADTGIETILIVGDFDDDQMNQRQSKTKEIFTRYGMSQFVEEPTNFCENSTSIIDLVLSNNSNAVDQPFLPDFRGDYDHFRRMLSDINWNDFISSSTNVDSLVERFSELLIDCASKAIPNKTITVGKSDPT
ncbi:unnamed protein product [Mytilus coruscus]|uniref:Uncharacterized protein n=1 Tax=Mytilus coruscus TaxID=42192 RepID=A0A6J8CIN5_MYTCO|nr:unnamed protein product [Mytilus coruscus]